MFGYLAMTEMLERLKICDNDKIQIKSQFFQLVFEMYNKMGDTISQQYGGSIAHHASMGKKKGIAVREMITSIKRHMTNIYHDPSKQRVLNLFLGIYNPANNPIPLFTMQDDGDLHKQINTIMRLPQIQGNKWWVQYIQDCESSLPTQLQRDLTDILTRSPDSDSDDEGLDQHITKNIELFNHDEKYVKNKDGIYYLEGD